MQKSVTMSAHGAGFCLAVHVIQWHCGGRLHAKMIYSTLVNLYIKRRETESARGARVCILGFIKVINSAFHSSNFFVGYPFRICSLLSPFCPSSMCPECLCTELPTKSIRWKIQVAFSTHSVSMKKKRMKKKLEPNAPPHTQTVQMRILHARHGPPINCSNTLRVYIIMIYVDTCENGRQFAVRVCVALATSRACVRA